MPEFEPNGPNSPFITSNINIDIPAAMKNSILGKRSSANIETLVEGKAIEMTRFFSSKPDPVMEILDSWKGGGKIDNTGRDGSPAERKSAVEILRKANIPEPSGGYNENQIRTGVGLDRKKRGVNPKTGEAFEKVQSEDDIRTRNIQEFVKSASLILNIRSIKNIRSAQHAGGRNLFVGAFDDPTLLKRFEIANSEIGLGGVTNNPSILAIEFSFETLGISGIKIGDTFKVKRLPKQYDSGIFQVMETSHNLSNGMWITTVKAKLRNV